MPYNKKLPKILSTTFVPFKVRYGYFLEVHNIRCLQYFTDCFSVVPLVMAFYKVPMDISCFSFYLCAEIQNFLFKYH